jgi:ArsR family transcriptional regulator
MQTMKQETTIFRALSDQTRLRLAIILAIKGETCVCMLAAALGEKDYNISRHLGTLKAAGLVDVRREGLWMYYRLTDSPTPLTISLIDFFRLQVRNNPTVLGDLARMETYECCKALPDADCR